jgi:hypothetical protein
MLAHAISSTRPTTASATPAIALTVPRLRGAMANPRAGASSIRSPARNSTGYFSPRRASIVSSSARACSRLTPRFTRPMTRSQFDSSFDSSAALMPAAAAARSGTQSAGDLGRLVP